MVGEGFPLFFSQSPELMNELVRIQVLEGDLSWFLE